MRTKTFGELRKQVLGLARVKDNFSFFDLGSCHRTFWHEMNSVEYDRGYDPIEYVKDDSPALWEMKLLTQEEFDEWVDRFRKFHFV